MLIYALNNEVGYVTLGGQAVSTFSVAVNETTQGSAKTAKLRCAIDRTISHDTPMAAYKNAQQHLVLKGRHFHFVSYDGQPANEKRGVVETGPMWYLMGPNKRWPVMPHVAGQTDEEIVSELKSWITGQGLDTV